MSTLSGKVAVVTGGSRGIGAAIARRLAEDGADVVITYERSADKAADVVRTIEAKGRRALAIRADSADPASVTAAIDEAAQRFGRLDILVNNAGVASYGAPEDASVEEIDRVLAINVRAVFVAVQAALRHMGEGGRLISIGSNLAERVPFAGITLYSMSKAALVGMTRGLARDLGPRGITVNLVNPGSTDTDMNPADGEGAEPQRSLSPLGRYGSVDDIAASVAHLAGEGGRTINGTAILVDGGQNA
ncbi:SDR family NAD(P)-dependent oxidoreductase [Marinivivus vitaminiproducens]|uniref:SDR family NAD(P)-dependent oxidoreductase n=1 Tax=Marinivivus vitaminiproducens TaxID=3035935 RepID=UPI00279DD7EE|nr:3-oxoacyl-ACP reductase FabG [Geminicoccaceae bacterium SCSIO 64248]